MKMIAGLRFRSIFTLWWLVSFAALGAAEISLPNLDFKEGLSHWTITPSNGKAAKAEILADVASEGKPCLRLTSTAGAPKVASESERFPVAPGEAYRVSFRARNVVNRSNSGLFLRFFNASGKELNNAIRGHDNTDQDIAIVNGLTGAEWTPYELSGIPPEGAVEGAISLRTWSATTVDFADLHLISFAPLIAPPWEPSYKIAAHDSAHLTEADVVGPDGRVYPDWRQAGVPGGIPTPGTVVDAKSFSGLEKCDIADALDKSIAGASKKGGGIIELPPGTFFLDRSIIIDQNRIVIRGAGREKTKLIFRDRIAYGKLRLFNWAGSSPLETGSGGTLELQANPKKLIALSLTCRGEVIAKGSRSTHWGNTYWLRVSGADLLQKLGPGVHQLEGKADYENGDHFSETFSVKVSENAVDAPAPTYPAAIVVAGGGPQGEKILLTVDAMRGTRRLQVASAASFHVGDRVRIEAPSTVRWNTLVGNRCPWGIYRATHGEITAIEGDMLVLAQPMRIEFPVIDGAWVQKINVVSGVGIEGLTLEQEIVTRDPSGPKGGATHWYAIEDLWTNGITFSFAWGCWARDLRVVNAGRNPIYLPRSKFCEVRDSEFDNALFKGVGGTAYVGFETAFDCLMSDVITRHLRHAPDLQWGASGNVIRNSQFEGSDAQFHAGWTSENLLEGNTISADAEDAESGGYGFGIFASGPSSPEHGPQGPRNVIYHNDVTSPSTGLVMLGGNENWLVLYNRFHIDAGHAVVGKEMSFDHIIADNVFVIEHPASPAVYFRAPNCTGIELTGNQFYGPIDKIAGFKGGFGSFLLDKGNQVFPLSPAPALPSPEVASIFLWQREQLKK